jgi:predicted transcriptional regulator
MGPMNADDKAKKEAMKRLRKARNQTIKRVSAKLKVQRKAIQAIKGQLEEEARTVPEIAEATGYESALVLWLITALRKYGEILEDEKDGSYFRYRLAGSVSD